MRRVIAVGLLVIALTGLTGCSSSGRFDTDGYLDDVTAFDVLQTANAFDNENIKLVGRVEQVFERSDGVCLQVDIQHTTMLTGMYPYPEDIHVEYHYLEVEPHLLPGHVITLYGRMRGVTEFDGVDVRLFYADYIKANDRVDKDGGLFITSYDVSDLQPSAVYEVQNNYHNVVELDFTVVYYDADGTRIGEDTQSSTGIKHDATWTFVFYPLDNLDYDTVDYEVGIRIGKYVDTSLDLLSYELIHGDDGYNQVRLCNKSSKPFEDVQVVVLYYDRDVLLSIYVLDGIYETAVNRMAPNSVMVLDVPSEIAATSYEIRVTANRVLDK